MKQEEIKSIEDRLRIFGDSFKGLKEQMESLIVTMGKLNDSLNKLEEFEEKEKDKELKFLVCRHCGSTIEIDINSPLSIRCSWCTGVSELKVHHLRNINNMTEELVYELEPTKP